MEVNFYKYVNYSIFKFHTSQLPHLAISSELKEFFYLFICNLLNQLDINTNLVITYYMKIILIRRSIIMILCYMNVNSTELLWSRQDNPVG